METTTRPRPASTRRAPGRARRAGVAVPAVALLLALGACGSDDGTSAEEPAPAPSSEASGSPGDELAAQGGELCPTRLPEPSDDETTAYDEPAASAPTIAPAEEAWVCRYDPPVGVAGPEEGNGWQRVGGPRAVGAERLAAVDRDLAALEPAVADRACTMDLGPRWLLVTATGGDLTGVVVDGFGCREVRVSSLPGERVAGVDDQGGAVPGVLQAPASLLGTLREVGETDPVAPGGAPMSQERWDAMIERLDCEGMPSVFMSDIGEPSPDTTLRQALAGWTRDGGEVRVDARDGDRAEASVVVDGEVVVVLTALRHPNGGWVVEGGAEC